MHFLLTRPMYDRMMDTNYALLQRLLKLDHKWGVAGCTLQGVAPEDFDTLSSIAAAV